LNGAKCFAKNKKEYQCVCTPGFEGKFCEIDINECEILDSNTGVSHSPCKNNGKCFNLINKYYCECSSSKTGKNCEKGKYCKK
jgi:hypothetical protein